MFGDVLVEDIEARIALVLHGLEEGLVADGEDVHLPHDSAQHPVHALQLRSHLLAAHLGKRLPEGQEGELQREDRLEVVPARVEQPGDGPLLGRGVRVEVVRHRDEAAHPLRRKGPHLGEVHVGGSSLKFTPSAPFGASPVGAPPPFASGCTLPSPPDGLRSVGPHAAVRRAAPDTPRSRRREVGLAVAGVPDVSGCADDSYRIAVLRFW